eukprot:4493280-Karenia_brevis.AAC.1
MHVRESAVKAWAEVAQEGDECAMIGVCACHEDEDRHIRKAAVNFVDVVAGKRYEHAIIGFSTCLQDAA